MRNFQLSALMLIVALTFCQRTAQAQTNNTTAQTKPSDELREKAFTVLESLAGQLNTLQSAENRARMGANIAESLWKHDETRARELFQLVQQDIKSRLVIPDDLEDRKSLQTFLVFLKLRSDTIERIIKYDPELAFSFLKATEVDLEKIPPYLVDNERNLELRLSRKLAGQNPDAAVRLARLALDRGFSTDVLSTLVQLNRKHKGHATAFFKQIVQKLRESDIKADWEARQFVSIMAQSFKPPVIEESAFKEFIDFLVTTAAANRCEAKPVEPEQSEYCQWISAMLGNVWLYEPSRSRMKRQELEREQSEGERATEGETELDTAVEEGSIDGVLALAAKYPELAVAAYWHALRMAKANGDLDRMRKIAEDFKGNPEGREEMLNEVARTQRMITFDDQQLMELQKQLNEAPRLEERVMLLVNAAYRAGASNRKMALQLVNRAEQVVETMTPGKEQSVDQIGVAIMYSIEKDERGFTIMESLVPKLNSLIDAAVKLDGYDTSYIRDGEWNMSAGGSLGELLTQLSDAAQFFAWNDFERAMNLAAQFERSEIRMMAQLKLAQGILAGPHKRFTSGY